MEGMALIDEGLGERRVLVDAWEEEKGHGESEEGRVVALGLGEAYHEESPCRVVEKDCSRYNEHG